MAKRKSGKWNRRHEFKWKKATKSTKGHPAYIFASRKEHRKFMIFTHSETTDGTKNIELNHNIDSTDKTRKSYMRPFFFVDRSDKFVEPHKKYRIHKEDVFKVNHYKKISQNKK